MQKKILKKLEKIAEKEIGKAFDAGHDISHVKRVFCLAQEIAKHEKNVDLDILQVATLLHDIGGPKEKQDPSGGTDHAVESAKMARSILEKMKFSAEKIKHIQDCIISHRFKTENKPKTIEAKILFDADKLDAVGAIGIARAFCWVEKYHANIYKKTDISKYVRKNMGGKINGRIQDKSLHSPQIEFEIKQKKLMKKLFTKTAKKICRQRLVFYKNFLNRLEKEVEGKI